MNRQGFDFISAIALQYAQSNTIHRKLGRTEVNKAFKFRIYPNSEQRELIAKTFGCVRFVYNKMLEEKIAFYKETGQFLKTTPAKYKTEYAFLKEVDSLALCNGQMNIETAYKNFYRDKSVGFPKFKSKRNDRKSYTTNLVNNNIRIEDGYIVLPKLGRVSMKQHRVIPDGYRLKSVTVSQSASGKYYAAILFEYEASILSKPISTVIGLDYSMAELYLTDSGERADYPRYYRRALDRLKRMQRSLSKMARYSKNYHKQKRKIAVLHEHVANQRKDFQHKQSRQIANAYDCAAIEDLNMKAMQ